LRGEYQKALNQYVRAEAALPPSDPRREEVQDRVKELSEYLRVPVPDGK